MPARTRRFGLVIAVASVALMSQAASAHIINLSTHSSDETDPALLSATMDFQVAGSILTLSVTNDTSASAAYFINELYFNGSDSVLGLVQTSGPTGWSFDTAEWADGFGWFDFALQDGVGGSETTIAPGETLVWTFNIIGAATREDFTSHLSTIPPGMNPAIVAGKFVSGPGDDSAFGATIPGPATLALLAAGLLCSRRRRS